MGSAFSSAFENILPEYRAVGSTFNNKLSLNIELFFFWSLFSTAFENVHLEYRAVQSIFRYAFKIIHNFHIELWVRHSALHSEIFILNIDLRDRRSVLIQHHTHLAYIAMGS